MKKHITDSGAMLNFYPDSMGETLAHAISFLQNDLTKDAFDSVYILPSIFNTDLDRGFSIIDYNLNENYADVADLGALNALNIDLKLDFVLNHISVLSPQFQDLIKNGDRSIYKDFFINWNKFWQGKGEPDENGCVIPEQEYIEKMFFRKKGLPILMVYMHDKSVQPYWNTFYQKINCEPLSINKLIANFGFQYLTAEKICKLVNAQLEKNVGLQNIDFGEFQKHKSLIMEYMLSNCSYLGQMDLNVESTLVWDYYDDTLRTLAQYGASIVRLDAFAYTSKKVGERNFLNTPDTWDILERVRTIADKYSLILLPEIHASYHEKIYKKIADEGYMGYDFFLPGLILNAFERKNADYLYKWANELYANKIKTVNMLGCHDGIPLLDLRGLLPDEDIDALINLVVARGGYVKNLHGQTNIYYQVNATYYSALGESERKMLLARAVQMFMPGKPQIWYLDLFAGKNDYKAVEQAGKDGHKEINRTNLTLEQIKSGLQTDIVKNQLKLIKMRNTFPAFGFNAKMNFTQPSENELEITWENNTYIATLKANLSTEEFIIRLSHSGNTSVLFEQ